MKLSKTYNPKEVEDKIYRLWQESGYFNPDNLPKTCNLKPKTYCIVIPLPNITGALHMGHALNAFVQDILIRWKRLQGYRALWVPGTDHAGIAAQNVVEKELKKQGLTRFDIGREELIKRIWAWRKKYGNIILEQLKKMGSSCDWSRTRFTLDKEYQEAVKKAFLHYYKKGWIYQGKRVVNWCVRCRTSLSDLEIEYKEEQGHLWYIRYPLKQRTKYITVATTRPETMLGDTAVAVNPNDKRYKKIVGEKVVLPLVNQEIPIIADRLVDPKFGTGAVKVTPAHDLCDHEIGLKHKLKSIQVINEKGKINKQAPQPYQGLKILEAREKVIEDLENLGLLEKIEDYTHQVPKCYRCGRTIELIPSQQWFLKMDKLADLAIKAVKGNKVRFHPKRWEKVYFDWLKNIRDWCVSRQIWWGHRIPLKGETDVLDTWFSSALWPFATLGWPKNTKDLKTFYPTDVLSTARDIINLWVARMVFSGMEFIGKAPFRDVYIHATVLTKEGKRMSKSLGTGINPMDLIEKYGADAVRFGVIWQAGETQDIKFGEDNIVMGKKFCNKVWNASRFVLVNKPPLINADFSRLTLIKSKKLTQADRKILKALDKTIKLVDKDLEKFQFGKAAHCLYDFFWHDFCDKYIEEFKNFQPLDKSSDRLKSQVKNESQQTLFYVFLTSLKLLHPFIPFITEEIYQKLPIRGKKKSLMVEKWPI